MRVSLIDRAEGLLLRVLELKVRGITITTPRKALSSTTSLCEADLQTRSARGVVEVYRRIRGEVLDKALSDEEVARRVRWSTLRCLGKAHRGELVIVIPEYVAEGRNVKLVEHLVHLLVPPGVSVLSTPVFRGVSVDELPKLIEVFTEAAASARDVYVTPLLPPLPLRMLNRLVKLYERLHGRYYNFTLSYLCIDFNGSNPVSKYDLLRYAVGLAWLWEQELGRPVIIHGVNVKFGRATHKDLVVPARDLVSPYVGVDIVGSNHKPLKVPRDQPTRRSLKLLNIGDYGYYDLRLAVEKPTCFEEPPKATIRLADVIEDPHTAETLHKLYNAERQALELSKLARMIVKGEDVKGYVSTKRQLDRRSIRVIERAYKDVHEQRKLL